MYCCHGSWHGIVYRLKTNNIINYISPQAKCASPAFLQGHECKFFTKQAMCL